MIGIAKSTQNWSFQYHLHAGFVDAQVSSNSFGLWCTSANRCKSQFALIKVKLVLTLSCSSCQSIVIVVQTKALKRSVFACLETLGSSDDFAHQIALDAVLLDHDKGTILVSGGNYLGYWICWVVDGETKRREKSAVDILESFHRCCLKR